MRPYGQHPAQVPEPAPSAQTPTAAVVDSDGTWPMHSPGGPCRTWPLAAGCGSLPPNPAEWTPEHRNAVEVATGLLWASTAGVFGLCRTTVRPCSPVLPAWERPRPVRPRLPIMARRDYVSSQACGCSGGCGCAEGLMLPGPVQYTAPVLDLEVWLDGQKFTAWKLFNEGRLIRTDDRAWPRFQDLRRPLRPPEGGTLADSADTFGIVYWRGLPVPAGGRRAVALLTDEILKACANDDACKLPSRLIATIQRQGVTYQLVDPRDFLDEGRIGITEIDLWIASVNPHKLKARPQVYSVDAIEWHTEPTSSAYPGGVP